jgi:hypothetical protein
MNNYRKVFVSAAIVVVTCSCSTAANYKILSIKAPSAARGADPTVGGLFFTQEYGGCRTNPTDMFGRGQHCEYPGGKMCFSTIEGHLLQRTLRNKKVVSEGVDTRCNISFDNYVSKYGGPLKEPRTICIHIYASSPSGMTNVGKYGEVSCRINLNYDAEVGH